MSEPVFTPRSSREGPGEGVDTLGGRNALVVIAVAACVLFAALGYRATLTEHEVFAAQPAREMLDGGTWVLQPFAGAVRVKKPPGQSWLIAASFAATRTQNEFTARLPSAVAATGLALLLGAIGARLASRRVGLVAALMTLTAHGVQDRARLAEADMALALAITACYASVLWALRESGPLSLWERARVRASADADTPAVADEQQNAAMPSPHPSPRGRGSGYLAAACAFWFALVAGVFLKGPILLGFVLPPLAIAYGVLRGRGERGAATAIRRTVLHPLPLVIGVAVVGAWVASALRLQPGIVDAWRHEVVDRASGEMRRDSPLAYVGLVPLALLPWTPFALGALGGFGGGGGRAAWRDALRRPAVLLLAAWAAFGFALVSCVALKALHYTLPILPPLLLLGAVGFDRALSAFLASRSPDRRAAFAGAALVGWFGVASAGWVVNQTLIEPRKDRGSIVKRFAAEVERVVPPGEPVHLVGVGEERTAWYVRRRLVQTRRVADDPIDAQIARLPAGVAYVLCRLPTEAALAARGSVEPLARSDDYRGRGEAFERRSLVRVRSHSPSAP